jgi:uncharacterized membrane protein
MAPFFERHERRSRRLLIALTCVSLALTAGIFAYGALTSGSPWTLLGRLWGVIVIYPAIGLLFLILIAFSARARRTRPSARPAMNADDARNAARVANAGLTYVVCVGLIMIATQAGLALGYFGVLPPLYQSGQLIARADVVAISILIAYFGNAWSRTPMARAGTEGSGADEIQAPLRLADCGLRHAAWTGGTGPTATHDGFGLGGPDPIGNPRYGRVRLHIAQRAQVPQRHMTVSAHWRPVL